MTITYRSSSNLSDAQASFVIAAKVINSCLIEFGFPDINFHKSKERRKRINIGNALIYGSGSLKIILATLDLDLALDLYSLGGFSS